MNKFRPRSFVSFALALSFFGAAFSGIVLYLRPEGSLARRISWHCLGLDKTQWEAVHITLTAAFVLFAAVHLGYNGKTLCSYVVKKTGTLRSVLFEISVAVLLAAVLAFISVLSLPPSSWLMQLRSEFKSGTMGCIREMPSLPDEDSVKQCESYEQKRTP